MRQYPDKPHDGFDEFRTGLDHFAFSVVVPRRAGRVGARARAAGHRRSRPIAETPIGTVIVFRDPDGIQLELWLPIGSP